MLNSFEARAIIAAPDTAPVAVLGLLSPVRRDLDVYDVAGMNTPDAKLAPPADRREFGTV